MDPNTTWLKMVNSAERINTLWDDQPDGFESEVIVEAETLATAVTALDDWLSHGGALPDAWAAGRWTNGGK